MKHAQSNYFSHKKSNTHQVPLSISLVLLTITLLVLSILSIKFGYRVIDWEQIYLSLFNYDSHSADHVVIKFMRIPRTLAALLIGSSLAMAGVLMQTISRNPLADPGILGVNAGAAVAVVLGVVLMGSSTPASFIWPAIAFSGLVAGLIFWLSSSGQADATPARLVLAGAAISALLFALVRAVLLVSQQSLDVYRQWVTGSLQSISFDNLIALLPFFIAAFVLVFFCSLLINALALGDDIAKSLGTRVKSAKALCLLAITLLCASSVALAGPISFIGLVVPHMARFFSGNDGRLWMIMSALLGAILLLLADILGRTLFENTEIQAGLMVALFGGVIFIWIIKRSQGGRL